MRTRLAGVSVVLFSVCVNYGCDSANLAGKGGAVKGKKNEAACVKLRSAASDARGLALLGAADAAAKQKKVSTDVEALNKPENYLLAHEAALASRAAADASAQFALTQTAAKNAGCDTEHDAAILDPQSAEAEAANGTTPIKVSFDLAAAPTANKLSLQAHSVCGDSDVAAFAQRNPNVDFISVVEDAKVQTVLYLKVAKNFATEPANGVPTQDRMIPVAYGDLAIAHGAGSVGESSKGAHGIFGGDLGKIGMQGGENQTSPGLLKLKDAGDTESRDLDSMLALSLSAAGAAVSGATDGVPRHVLAGVMTCNVLTAKDEKSRPAPAMAASFLARTLPASMQGRDLSGYAGVDAVKAAVEVAGGKLNLSLEPAKDGDIKFGGAALIKLASALVKASTADEVKKSVAESQSVFDAISNLASDCPAVGEALGGSDKASWAKALGSRDLFGINLPCAVLDGVGSGQKFKDLVAGLSDFPAGKGKLAQRLVQTEIVLTAANVMPDDWFKVNYSCLPAQSIAVAAPKAPISPASGIFGLPGRTGEADIGGYFADESPAQAQLYFNKVLNNVEIPLGVGANGQLKLSDEITIVDSPYPQSNLLSILGSKYLDENLGNLFMTFDTVTYQNGSSPLPAVSAAADLSPLAAAVSAGKIPAPTAPSDMRGAELNLDIMLRSADSTCQQILGGRSFSSATPRKVRNQF